MLDLRKMKLEKTRRRIKSSRRRIVFLRDGGRCRYCGNVVQYETFHLDHIVPRSEWGNDYVFNLATSCPECNMSKGANGNIVPKPLPPVKKLYEIYLILKFGDYPSVEDFI